MNLRSIFQTGAVGAAIVALAATGVASSAAARGIAIDQIQPASIGGCTLGQVCAANNFNQTYDFNFIGPQDPSTVDTTFDLGVFNSVFVYKDGVVSIGAPLPAGASLAGGLGSLGSHYIAAGFSDLTNANSAGDFQVTGSVDPTFTPDGSALVAQTVNIEWIFDTPAGEAAILGLSLTDRGNGQILAQIDSGADTSTWFGVNYANAFCDAECQNEVAASGFGTEGVYLPNGALIGSGFNGFGPPVTVGDDFTYPGFQFTFSLSSTPEPATWALSLFGFLMLGGRLRRDRGGVRPAT